MSQIGFAWSIEIFCVCIGAVVIGQQDPKLLAYWATVLHVGELGSLLHYMLSEQYACCFLTIFLFCYESNFLLNVIPYICWKMPQLVKTVVVSNRILLFFSKKFVLFTDLFLETILWQISLLKLICVWLLIQL